ncbi:MAG: hypothetical protein A3F74_03155 [Betaproteobacteria bacterium RIFCSPLOWO2_12_FULL_62_58]|nr:MAG: hypothetical protein A3F74_03155 [Betaproteobacteria bacterium RIFCSPLOWO2_12_FULL_62_58]
MTIDAFTGLTMPSRLQQQPAFDTNTDAMVAKLPTLQTQINATGADFDNAVAALAASSAISIPYIFDTATADADPGAGKLRLDNATQNLAGTMRCDLLDSGAIDRTAVLDTFGDQPNSLVGQIRLVKTSDPTKWITFDVTALASPAGYRNISVTVTGSSAASPFANADALTLYFTRSGHDENAVNTQNVAAHLVLTLTAKRNQVLTPTAAGLHVQFPDATLLGTQRDKYLIKVPQSAAYELGVRDGAGNLLRAIRPGGQARLTLHDNSTTAGGWSVAGDLLSRVFVIRSNTINAGRTFTQTYALKLSATLVVYLGRESSTLYGRAHDLSTDTLGAWTSLDASWGANAIKHAFAVSGASGIAFSIANPTRAVAFSVDGALAITPGTPQNATAGTGLSGAGVNDSVNSQTVVALTATLYCAFGFTGAGPFQPVGQACSVAGTVITWGAQTSLGATLATNPPEFGAVVMRSATQAMVWYAGNATKVMNVSHLTFAGTVITHDSRASGTGELTSWCFGSMAVLMQADEWWLLAVGITSGQIYVGRWTVSGVTATVTESTVIASVFTNDQNSRHANTLIKVSAAVAWMLATSAATSGELNLYKLAWSGSFTATQHLSGAGLPSIPVPQGFCAPKLDGDTQKALWITAMSTTTYASASQPGQLVWMDEAVASDVPVARCVAQTGQFFQNGSFRCGWAVGDTDRWRVVIGSAAGSGVGGAMAGRVVLMPRDQNPGRAVYEDIPPLVFNEGSGSLTPLASGVIAGDKIALFGSRGASPKDGYGMISLIEIADVA